jgi:hypothetical protein
MKGSKAKRKQKPEVDYVCFFISYDDGGGGGSGVGGLLSVLSCHLC